VRFYEAIQAQKKLKDIFPPPRTLKRNEEYALLAIECRELRDKGYSIKEVMEVLGATESFVRRHAF